MTPWHRFLDFVSSIKLTLVCLVAALLLVFAGTLAQVHFSAHVVQERYFQSMLIWWSSGAKAFSIPVFPGGHLVGAVLLVNLFAAHLRRFRLSWRNAGIHLIHGGLILMLAGGLFTDLFSVESQMQLKPGETKNYSEDTRRVELAMSDEAASRQEMRPVRHDKPYSITLQKFTHETHPGTDIPKKFTSQITLTDPARGVRRDVLISMNHPFRYGGETYYQLGFGQDDSSILQVVRNPIFVAPYIACVIISLGLLLQFGYRFVGFTRRTRITPTT